MKKSVAPALGAVAAIAAGFSLSMMGAGSAIAGPTCSNGGTSLGNGVCELTITSTGLTTFTPDAKTTKLEAVLVGGGGSSQEGYGGGGGEVTLLNFTDLSTPIDFTVGVGGDNTSVGQGALSVISYAGLPFPNGVDAGWSGSGKANWNISDSPAGVDGSAGGGAGASPTSAEDGGAGVVVAAIAPAGSLFTGDTNCYGGGGAIEDNNGLDGTATCGGGSVAASVDIDPTPNTGGGGGSSWLTPEADPVAGASGVVIVRWQDPVLAETGVDINPLAIPGALIAIVLGSAATLIARRRRTAA
jgi:hypothetical protein